MSICLVCPVLAQNSRNTYARCEQDPRLTMGAPWLGSGRSRTDWLASSDVRLHQLPLGPGDSHQPPSQGGQWQGRDLDQQDNPTAMGVLQGNVGTSQCSPAQPPTWSLPKDPGCSNKWWDHEAVWEHWNLWSCWLMVLRSALSYTSTETPLIMMVMAYECTNLGQQVSGPCYVGPNWSANLLPTPSETLAGGELYPWAAYPGSLTFHANHSFWMDTTGSSLTTQVTHSEGFILSLPAQVNNLYSCPKM